MRDAATRVEEVHRLALLAHFDLERQRRQRRLGRQRAAHALHRRVLRQFQHAVAQQRAVLAAHGAQRLAAEGDGRELGLLARGDDQFFGVALGVDRHVEAHLRLVLLREGAREQEQRGRAAPHDAAEINDRSLSRAARSMPRK